MRRLQVWHRVSAFNVHIFVCLLCYFYMIFIIVYFNNGTDDGNVDDDNDSAVAVFIIIGIIINLYNAWSINNCSRTLYQHTHKKIL